MTKSAKRDNAYYEDRLRLEHSTIHADYRGGKYPTLADAMIASGLKKKRTRLQELQNAWAKASPAEQRNFIFWLKASAPGPRSRTQPISADRLLLPWAKARIGEIQSRRGLNMGDIMGELGLNRGNGSLGRALNRISKLQPGVIASLEKWIEANKHV